MSRNPNQQKQVQEEGNENDSRNTMELEDPIITMESIIEKLKILNQETQFCQNKGFKPLNHTFFSIPSNNSTEQFIMFTSLTTWLFTLNNHSTQGFSKQDEPSTVCNNIQNECRKLNVNTDFPPNKLKQGQGEAVCQIIDRLLDRTLQYQKFKFKNHKCKEEGNEVEYTDIEGDDDQLLLINEDDDIFEENVEEDVIDDDNNVIESNIDPYEWKLECERVAPKLRYNIDNASKEWRGHLDHSKELRQNIFNYLPETKHKLERLSDELNNTLEKITRKENSINKNMDSLSEEYKMYQNDFNIISEKYRKVNENVMEYNNLLNNITDRLDNANQKMNDASNAMTDVTPLQKIKQAISEIRTEICQMDIRLGVLNHSILQHRLKERTMRRHEENFIVDEEFDNE